MQLLESIPILLLVLAFGRAAVAVEPLVPGFRPPAVPLVMNDPFMNIWSFGTQLTDVDTTLWTGNAKTMVGLIRIDGSCYRWMGSAASAPTNCQQPMTQISTAVDTQRIFGAVVVCSLQLLTVPAAGDVTLTVTFSTPHFASSLETLISPVTYVTFTVNASSTHQVSVYIDAAADFTVSTPNTVVTWFRPSSNDIVSLAIGAETQYPLSSTSDQIGWGYLYLSAQNSANLLSSIATCTESRSFFSIYGALPYDAIPPRPANASTPCVALAVDFGAVSAGQAVEDFVMISYDDIYSIDWFGLPLEAYWKQLLGNMTQAIAYYAQEYNRLMGECEAWDAQVIAAAMPAGGHQYATLLSLAYRQVTAACKAVWNPKLNTPWYFLKEISSDGDLSTVDVIFPASPFFLHFNATVLAAMFTPIYQYATSQVPSGYTKAWSPHHLGLYPIAEEITQEDMPIEETGNMILMVAAIYQQTKSVSFYSPAYDNLMRQWADYLVANLPFPGNQLCTDDFEGPSPNNSNLAAKGIVALGAYSWLIGSLGNSSGAAYYMSIAKNYSATWQQYAYTSVNGSHYRLQYNLTNSWSLKYNLLYQKVLGLSVFPQSVIDTDDNFNWGQLLTYGIPLDDRNTFTKLDWEFWMAALTRSPTQRQQLVSTLFNWANETPTRVPLTDWYYCTNGAQTGFQARPVVGGLWSLLLPNV